MSMDTDPRPKSRNVSLIAALAVLVVAVLALAVVGVASLLPSHKSPPTAQHTTPPTSPTAAASAAGCPTDTATVLTAAPVVQWQTLGQMTLPTGGAVYGPCQLTATTATGYAHTPGGALIAAVQIFARSTTSAPVDVAVATVQGQFIHTTDRDILLNSAKTSPRQSLSPDRVGRVAAYQVSAYTPDTASLSVAYRADALPGQYVAMRLVVQWLDGDWRMVPPLAGTWSGAGEALTELPGFTAWGP